MFISVAVTTADLTNNQRKFTACTACPAKPADAGIPYQLGKSDPYDVMGNLLLKLFPRSKAN